MCEKSGYLPLRVIHRASPAKCRVRTERRQKCIARVKPYAGATGIRLADDTVKECLRDYIGHRHIIGRWRGIAWALSAPGAAISIPGATIAVPAATEAL